jgi:hypothetical protein
MSLWSATDANTGAPKFAPLAGHGISANGDVLFDNVTVGVFKSNVAVGIFGVDASEAANTSMEGHRGYHAGWVTRMQGTGPVQSIAIVSGGKGYTDGYLTITGGGTGNNAANASFTVRANGSVDGITVGTPGAGYSNGYLTITGGGTGNVAANASYTVNAAGNIVSVVIHSGGSNYDSVPTVVALGANTETAVLTATCNTGVITAITLGTPGSNYVTTPAAAALGANNATATFAVTMGGRANRVAYETIAALGSIAADAGADDAVFGV